MLQFATSRPFTLGVEMEVQLVDAASFDLTPYATEILRRANVTDGRIGLEIFQSMLEVSTGIANDAHEAEADLRRSFELLLPITRDLGVRMVSAGTHPFAHWVERVVSPSPRYDLLIERNQWIARRLMIFGLHVHVGMPSAEACIAIQNELAYDLGLMLALSASSPYWLETDTGLASSRITIFEAMPTGGMPSLTESWDEFEALVNILRRGHAITSLKDLWWDVRPSPGFGTLEIRVCDSLPSLTSTVALVALIQALAKRAWARVQAGTNRRPPPPWYLRENKWRASRHGMNAELLLDLEGDTLLAVDLLERTLGELAPIFRESNYEGYADRLRQMAVIANGSSLRQRAIHEETGSLAEVVRALADEFEAEFDAA